MIVGLVADLDFALMDLVEELGERKREFNVVDYKDRFIVYLNGGTDNEIEMMAKKYSYVFIAYSNLDKLIRNRRINK